MQAKLWNDKSKNEKNFFFKNKQTNKIKKDKEKILMKTIHMHEEKVKERGGSKKKTVLMTIWFQNEDISLPDFCNNNDLLPWRF